MQINQTIHYSMAAPVRFYYSITTHTPAVLPVLIVYGLYTTSNPFEVIIQISFDSTFRVECIAFVDFESDIRTEFK